jgi:integrase/recombinase XerD
MYRTFPTEQATPMRDRKSPLADTIREYLDSQHHFTPKTARNYAQVLGEFDRWLGKPTLGDLTAANVNKFIAAKGQAGHHFAARNAAATLKRFAVYLSTNQIMSGPRGSVLAAIEVPRPRKEGRKPFTDEEVGAILKAAIQGPFWARDRAMVAAMLGCGLRLNEARELALEDVNFEKRVVTIRAETSKSGRGRQVRLDPVSAQALSLYIKDWRPTGPSSQIFLAKSGKPLSYLGMHHAFARMRLRFAKLGIKNFQAHRLRHTWATGYHRSGGSLFDLQSEGGWSDLTMVRRYARSTPITELQRRPTPLAWLMSKKAI